MKKFLKIFFIVIAVLFLILLVAPFLFKGKIIEFAKKQLNDMLTVQVDFADLKLSFIRNFPNAYVALEDLTVIGTGEFANDTLLSLKKFSVTVDIKSVIGMENINVKSVLLDQARVHARIAESGHVNWDVMKPSDETTPEPESESSSDLNMKVALKHFEIRDAYIVYQDDSSKMLATVKGLDFLLKGDMSLDYADLQINMNTAAVDFWMDGIRMLNSAVVKFDSEIGADLKNMGFTFKDNEFRLNEIILKFAGSVLMPTDDIVTDITFATEKTEFKSLLSLIPAIYMTDFASVQTSGNLVLDGYVKGTYNDKQMPNAGINLKVGQAMFKYPSLPKSVDKINAAVRLFYDGVVFDNTTVDVDQFHFEMAGNPFDMELHVKTPDSDMQVAAKFAGRIDFNSIQDIVPLEGTQLKGVLDCDLALAGRMSTLEKEQYEDFQAEGMLKLSGFEYIDKDFPQGVKINSTQLNFTPKKVDLVNFDALIGSTDIAMNGSLENFIPYVFKDATVRGNLALKSKMINLNEFMGDSAEETPVAEDTTSLSIIEVPKNIDFKMNANVGTILYDKLTINNTVGVLYVKDGKVRMDNLSMDMLEGKMVLNGEYNTQDMTKPSIDFNMNVSQFDITSTLSSFSMMESMFPEPQNYVGKVSAKLTLNSLLDQQMSPVLNSIESKGTLNTHNIEIRNSKIFGKIADVLKNEKYRTLKPGDLTIHFEIKEGRVMFEPINFDVPPVKVALSGDQGLDQTLNYAVKVTTPTSSIGAGADLLSRLPGGSTIKELSLAGKVTGTISDPKIQLDMTNIAGTVIDAAKQQVTEAVTQKIEETKAQVREEVAKQVDNLMAEAQKQAQNVRDGAKSAADKLRSEANSAADKLEGEAKNAIQKQAAKIAADKLRKEGEANAKKLEQEGEKQAQSIIDTATQKAEEIKSK